MLWLSCGWCLGLIRPRFYLIIHTSQIRKILRTESSLVSFNVILSIVDVLAVCVTFCGRNVPVFWSFRIIFSKRKKFMKTNKVRKPLKSSTGSQIKEKKRMSSIIRPLMISLVSSHSVWTLVKHSLRAYRSKGCLRVGGSACPRRHDLVPPRSGKPSFFFKRALLCYLREKKKFQILTIEILYK
jgi:hypothetical protein